MNCVGITHRSIGERSFTGAEMTQRQLIAKSPDKHGWQVTKAGILELTVQLVGNSTGERIVFQATPLISISFRKFVQTLSLPDVCFVSASCRQFSLFESFPESSTVFFLFQALWLVSDSSRQLSWSGSVSPVLLHVNAQGRRDLVFLVSFSDFLRLLSCLLSES